MMPVRPFMAREPLVKLDTWELDKDKCSKQKTK